MTLGAGVTDRPKPIADAITSSTRAVTYPTANALWPRLRAGPAAWQKPRLYIATNGGTPGGIRTTTPPVPPPDAKYRTEIIRDEVVLRAFAPRTKTQLGVALRVFLYKPDHDAVLRSFDHSHQAEYRRALTEATCERPFYRQPEQPGGWRRNPNDALITPRVAAVLEQLAAISVVEFLSPEVEDALLT